MARFDTRAAPGSGSSRASKCAGAGRVETESSQALTGASELRDVVEPALARALVVAAEAQRWDVVVQIAAELQASRESRRVANVGQGISTRPKAVSPLVRGRPSEM
jgi:hypothetical protein